jgi:hypothetical protein
VVALCAQKDASGGRLFAGRPVGRSVGGCVAWWVGGRAGRGDIYDTADTSDADDIETTDDTTTADNTGETDDTVGTDDTDVTDTTHPHSPD